MSQEEVHTKKPQKLETKYLDLRASTISLGSQDTTVNFAAVNSANLNSSTHSLKELRQTG